jgi:hypothetical protein
LVDPSPPTQGILWHIEHPSGKKNDALNMLKWNDIWHYYDQFAAIIHGF